MDDYHDLILRAIRNARTLRPGAYERWVAVRDTFAIGSTRARALCEDFGLDPDTVIRAGSDEEERE